MAAKPDDPAAVVALETAVRGMLAGHVLELEPGTIYGLEVFRRHGARAHDWFAGVQRVEGAVKLNFLPMHAHPELLDGISPELRKRKTGASVFRLRPGDEALLAELESVIARGSLVYMGDD